MREYLLKIHKMNAGISDPSELHAFASAAKAFLKAEDSHAAYTRPLARALKTAKNRYIVACIFDIAASLNVGEGFLHEKYMRKYFKHTTTRHSVLGYLNSFGISFLDAAIRRAIEKDACFLSEEVYRHIKSRKTLSRDLLLGSNPELAPKQLDIIINCRVFFSIQSYVRLLGHSTKLVSFKAFEAFSLFFSEVSADEGVLDTFDLRSAVRKREERSGGYCLSVHDNSVCILDAANFIVFGWCFLPEKLEILELARSKDCKEKTARLQGIVNKYSAKSLEIGVDISEDNLATYKPGAVGPSGLVHRDAVHCVFDHLFARKCKKACCDCYEI